MVAFKLYARIKTIVSVSCQENLQEAVTERCSLKSIKSEKIKTFYLLSVLEEPLQIDYSKACSNMEQA